MFHVQVRDAKTADWRDIYSLGAHDVPAQVRQCEQTNAFYDFQRARVVETLAGEFVREVPAEEPYLMTEQEEREAYRVVADRIAARYREMAEAV